MSPAPDSPARVLVLGATGHIGSAVVRHLLRHGYSVKGLARAPSTSTRGLPIAWVYADLTRLRSSGDWLPIVEGCDSVVNAAGALQDGSRDRLADVHVAAIAALAAALPASARLVHISAPGVSATSSTAFYRSKAAGDEAVRNAACAHVILRPALVVSPEAYGGTALLRALAALPIMIPAITPKSPMQTVDLADVCDTVRRALAGDLPNGSDLILAEPAAQPLADVLLAFRRWLGLPDAPVVEMPRCVGRLVALGADLAGHAGWRSPLRSTALQVSAEGVTGDSGLPCKPLEETLAQIPATVQDRWFARLYFVKALGIVTVASFWLLSGLIGVAQREAAASVLTTAGLSHGPAMAFVLAGSAADVLLGTLVLFRRTMPLALLGMIALTLGYLVSASLVVPNLWADPLGPLVKTIPAIVLALFLLAVAPER